ncbi:hypothetical protein NFI96_011419, partial [Prochilodus magdalenae]
HLFFTGIKQTQADWCCQHQGSLSQVYEEKREATQSDSNVRVGLSVQFEFSFKSTLYKGLVGDPLDLSLLQIGDAYKGFDIKEKPLVATMGISDEKTLVETAFGMAYKGVLSYQLSIFPTKSVKMHQDAPPYPPLPPEEYRLHPIQCVHSRGALPKKLDCHTGHGL